MKSMLPGLQHILKRQHNQGTTTRQKETDKKERAEQSNTHKKK